ncbi:cyclin-domain-containing protein [Circinella umbellata]|nr:cyclin-domain-containing protein [Circinella umbellata]
MATKPSTTAMNDTEVIQVPEYFYAVDISYLTHMIDMLGRLISHNDLIPLTPNNLTRFHSRTPPNISLNDYLRRIVKYASVEKACLLVLLIYIDRVCELHPQFTISSLTVHRFLITAVTVSSKSLCDSYCTNSHYAKVGGISTQELNALELEFLRLINWNLSSSGPVLQQYYTNLVQQHPCYERMKQQRRNNSNDVSSSSLSSTITSSSLLLPTSSSSAAAAPPVVAPVAAAALSNGSIWKDGKEGEGEPSTKATTSVKRKRSSTLVSEEALTATAAVTSTTSSSISNSNNNSSNFNNNNNNTLSSTTPMTVNKEEEEEDVERGKEKGNVLEEEEQMEQEETSGDEEQKTIRHFDKLLQRDWIPYIA